MCFWEGVHLEGSAWSFCLGRQCQFWCPFIPKGKLGNSIKSGTSVGSAFQSVKQKILVPRDFGNYVLTVKVKIGEKPACLN